MTRFECPWWYVAVLPVLQDVCLQNSHMRSRKNSQSRQSPISQPVFGQHTRHSVTNDLRTNQLKLNDVSKKIYLVWLFLHHVLVRCFLETPRVHRVLPIYELVLLATGDLDIARMCNDDIVSAIHWQSRTISVKRSYWLNGTHRLDRILVCVFP